MPVPSLSASRFFQRAALPQAILLACLGLVTVAPVVAQPAQTQAEQQVAQYNIPAGNLDQVLNQFASAANILLAIDASLTEGYTSNGLRGSYSLSGGLAAILANTPLAAIQSGPGQYRLRRAEGSVTTLPPVTVGADVSESATGPVNGYTATRSLTASKTDSALTEVPQSISVVGRDQMEYQGAQSVQQALRYSPGVVAAFGDSDSRTDVLQARGYYLRDYLDGSRVPFGAYSVTLPRVEPYGLERIEVLKGPASVLYGQSTPGGMVNMVTKRPTRTPLKEAQLQTGNYDRLQGAVDFSGPVPGNDRLLYRLTGLVRDAKGRTDFAYDEHQYIAPAVTWEASPDTTISLLSHIQHDDVISDYVALPARGTLRDNPNGELSRSRYPGEPDYDGYERDQFSLSYFFDHRVSDTALFSQSLKYTDVTVDTRATPSYMLAADDATIMRVASQGEGESDTLGFDNRLQLDLQQGDVLHKVLVGYDYLHLNDRYDFASNLIHSLDLYNPVYNAAPIPALIPRFSHDQDMDQHGLYVQDQARLDNWILTLSGRYDRVDSTIRSRMAGTKSKQDDDAFTYRIGLNYQFDNGLAPFASYSTSFEPTTGADFSGNDFESGTGEQIEAGLKFLSPDDRYFLSASVFSTVQENVLTPDPDPTHAGFSVQTGEVEVKGVDVEAKLMVASSLNLTFAYAYNDTEVTKANPGSGSASLLGNPLPRTPKEQVSLWLDYSVPAGPLSGLGVGGGFRYVGSSFGDNAATMKVPSYTLWDAMVRYELGSRNSALNGLDLSVNVSNLLDEDYVGYCASELQCFYGQSRTLYATVNYRW